MPQPLRLGLVGLNFAQRIRGEVAEDVTQPEDIVAAVRVVNAMREAERTGQTVSL